MWLVGWALFACSVGVLMAAVVALRPVCVAPFAKGALKDELLGG